MDHQTLCWVSHEHFHHTYECPTLTLAAKRVRNCKRDANANNLSS